MHNICHWSCSFFYVLICSKWTLFIMYNDHVHFVHWTVQWTKKNTNEHCSFLFFWVIFVQWLSFLFNDCHFCSMTVILNKMTSLNKNDICSVKSFLFNMFKFLFIFGHFCSKWPMNKSHFVHFWRPLLGKNPVPCYFHTTTI